jgi:TonB-linked SusC/RagA family outer membrane protein
MMKNVVLAIGMLLLSAALMAQSVTLNGKVVDQAGVPMLGVNVIERNTSNGTITNADGMYSLTVSQDAVIVFSFVGFQSQQIALDGLTEINLTLIEDVYTLDEAVVTALGISRAKKSVGYSTQEVEMEDLQNTSVQNIGNLMTGKIAGLAVSNPTGMFQAPTFSLRGRRPLVVIDDIPIESDLYDINPSNIESINVLKGTTASALYGSRGRNGAILITTKKAKKEGLNVTVFNSTMVTAGFTVYPETQNEYGNGSNGQYEFWDGKDGGISDGDMVWGPAFADNLEIAQWNSPIRDMQTGETIDWYGDVSGTMYDDRSRYERVPIPWEFNDFLNEFLETGYVTNTDVSISYKGEKSSQRFAVNYNKMKGQVPNTELHTGGASLISTYQLAKNLELDTKFSYNKVYSPNYPRYGYGPKNHMYTILIWMGWDVNAQDMRDHLWVPGQEGYRQANFNYAWYNNPFFAANELNQMYDEDLYNGQIKLKYNITKDLSIQGRVSGVIRDRFEDRQSPKSYLNYGDPRDGDYKTWNRNWIQIDNDIILTYHKQLGSSVNLTVNAGAASFYHSFEDYYNATDGLIVPDVYSLNNTRGNVKASTYKQQKLINSAYGTINLDLLDAFFLTLAARNDWSSALPEADNSFFYPSASLSTIVSNLFEMPEFIRYFKVYGSWARVDADLAPPVSPSYAKIETNLDAYRASVAGYANPYQFESYYINAGSFDGKTMLTYPSGIVNPFIKPEQSVSFELGLSSSFFENRLMLDAAYYNVVDKNQIINLPTSEASGFTSRKVNGNEYTTNGVEVFVNTVPVRKTNLVWNLGFNWDHRVRKLTEIYGDASKFGNYSVGERVDNYYSTGWMKSPDGEVIVDATTGLPSKDPYPQMFGHLEPDWRFGIQNTLKFNQFTLNVDIDGVVGGVMWSRTVEKMWWGGKHPNSVEYRDADYFAGIPNYVPNAVNVTEGELVRDAEGNIISDTRVFQDNSTALSWQTWSQNYPYRARVNEEESEFFANVLSRSFIKLRRVALSYDLGSAINSKTIKGAQVSLFGYNLLILKKAMIIDPDFGHDNDLQDPSARYIGASLSFDF